MKKLLLLGLTFLMANIGYTQVSEEITFTHESYQIHGTLTKPATSGKFPLIVICPGSGANDRDGTIPMLGSSAQCMYPDIYGDTLRTYKDLAIGLTARGYAVIRYDKIEYTYTSLGTITFKKLWLPFESAVDYAKTRNDIDVSNIILVGHSEGGMLIPYVAHKRNDIKALINLAGSRTPFDSLLAYQYREFPRKCGDDTTQTDAIASQVLAYFTLIRSGNWNSSTPPFAGVSASVWAQYTHIGDSVLINYNLAAKPTLFIGLEKDNNVPVATEYERFKSEVTTPATFAKFPNLIHYMNPYNSKQASPEIAIQITLWLQSQGITGIEEQRISKNQLTVFQESDRIRLEVANDILTSAELIDITGKHIDSVIGDLLEFRISGLQSGIYFVTAIGEKRQYRHKIWIP
jgi:uncharacterized protein